MCVLVENPQVYSRARANNELLCNYSVKSGECGTYLGSDVFFHAFGVEEFVS